MSTISFFWLRVLTVFALSYCLIAPGVIFSMDQTLLNRQRTYFEWDSSLGPTDHDHLGRGWDNLYLARYAKTAQESKSYYRLAEEEFNYVINHLINYSATNNIPLLVNRVYLGAAMGMVEVGYWTKRPNLAKPIYAKALEASPDNNELSIHYIMYLKRINSLPEAILILEKAVQSKPKDPDLHYRLGLLYFDNKQYDLARKEAEKCEQLGGVDIDKLNEKLNSVSEGRQNKKKEP